MTKFDEIHCRVAACREALDDDNEWSFYLINDNDVALDSAVLNEVGYEWGDWSNSEAADVQVTGLPAGAYALIWRDDGDAAELRMDLWLRVRLGDREAQMLFEFPKLCKKESLPLVEGLGEAGVASEWFSLRRFKWVK